MAKKVQAMLQTPPATRWGKLREMWLASLASGRTAQVYAVAQRQFFDFCPCAPGRVGPDEARAWAARLVRQGLAPRTVNVKLAALYSYFEYLREQDAWEAERLNPFDPGQVPRQPESRPVAELPAEVLAAIFRAINLESGHGVRDFALLCALVDSDRPAAQVLSLTYGQARRALSEAACNAIDHYLERVGRLESIRAEEVVFLPLHADRAKRLGLNGRRAAGPISLDQARKILKKYARRVGYCGPARLTMLRHCRWPAGVS